MKHRLALTSGLLAAAITLPTALTSVAAPSSPNDVIYNPVQIGYGQHAPDRGITNLVREATIDRLEEALSGYHNLDKKDPKRATAARLNAPTLQDGTGQAAAVHGKIAVVGGTFNNVINPKNNRRVKDTKNFVAFNAKTGNVIGRLKHKFNGGVRTVEFSPDGKTIYVGGDFTKVDGERRNRFAAIDVRSGDLLDLNPSFDFSVNGIAATDDTIYVGGKFNTVNGIDRKFAAAITPDNEVTDFNPRPNMAVNELTLEPWNRYVVLAGSFNSLGRYWAPGWGAVHPGTGGAYRWTAANTVSTYSQASSMVDIDSDRNGFYVAGQTFGRYGRDEQDQVFSGTAAAHLGGRLNWVNDPAGKQEGVAAMNDVVYSVNSGMEGMPAPSFQYAEAHSTKYTEPREFSGGQFGDVEQSKRLNWFPHFQYGRGGPRAVDANDGYVLVTGDFEQVNDQDSRGIALFGTPEVTDQAAMPMTYDNNAPKITRCTDTELCIETPAIWDHDSSTLQFNLFRDGELVGMYGNSNISRWNRETHTFYDTLPWEGTYSYVYSVTDADGNILISDVVYADFMTVDHMSNPEEAAADESTEATEDAN